MNAPFNFEDKQNGTQKRTLLPDCTSCSHLPHCPASEAGDGNEREVVEDITQPTGKEEHAS